MFAIKTILHPTDFSDLAENAFHLACNLARQNQAHLILVYVNSPPPPPPLPYNEAGLGTFEESEEAAEIRLDQMRSAHPDLDIECLVTEGKPAAEILRLARERHVDLIVMGTHGRTGLNRALMGSVAEEVIRKAPARVITVRERAEEAEATSTEEFTSVPSM